MNHFLNEQHDGVPTVETENNSNSGTRMQTKWPETKAALRPNNLISPRLWKQFVMNIRQQRDQRIIHEEEQHNVFSIKKKTGLYWRPGFAINRVKL